MKVLKVPLSQPLRVILEGISITQQEDYQQKVRSGNGTGPHLPAIDIFDFFLILVRP